MPRTRFPALLSGFMLLLAIGILAGSEAANAHEDREIGDFDIEVGFMNEPAFEGQANGAFIKITTPTIDVVTHGALFGSGTVSPGDSFSYEFGDRLTGNEIHFHDHLTGNGGTVTVAHDAPDSGMVMVQFDGAFSPSELSVKPGTTVMFMNASAGSVMTVVSGPHDGDDGHEHSHEDGAGIVEGEPVLGASATLQVEVTHNATGEKRVMDLRPLIDDPGGYIADFIPTSSGAYTFRFFGELEGEPFDEAFTSGPNTFDEVVPARTIQFPIELRESRELQGAVEGVQEELLETGKAADDADSTASLALIIGIVGVIIGLAGAGTGAYGIMLARRRG